jgi:hypothetical protein
MLVVVVWWEYRCVISFRILSLLPGFWEDYWDLYVMLNLPSLGLTMGVG